jgi:formylglycine-generating enzyme required for sulfatase activity
MAGCGGAGVTTGTSGGSGGASSEPSAEAEPSAETSPSAVPSVALATARPPEPGSTPGQTRTDAFGIEQVWVPAGTFRMGTAAAAIAAREAEGPPTWVAPAFDSEQPDHPVRLTKGYWLDRFEVTNGAFAAFVTAGGYTDPARWSAAGRTWLAGQGAKRLPLHCQGDVPAQPRMCITWYEAEAYANWRAGRLPTEAEWEYAARGPGSRVYPWGDTFDIDRANVVNSVSPKPVGSYPNGASWVGAQDMAGNAMEWVADWLDPTWYAHSPTDDPTGPATGTIKVEKGGWWGSNPFVARSAYRHYEDPPTYGDKHIGFRVASS